MPGVSLPIYHRYIVVIDSAFIYLSDYPQQTSSGLVLLWSRVANQQSSPALN